LSLRLQWTTIPVDSITIPTEPYYYNKRFT